MFYGNKKFKWNGFYAYDMQYILVQVYVWYFLLKKKSFINTPKRNGPTPLIFLEKFNE